jgi:peptidoglycan/xylan/chitin deacetylase (PgdA/CDA1 family)
MDRRRFLTIASAALTHTALPLAAPVSDGPRVAVTMDDFTVLDDVLPVSERGARILEALRRHGATAMGLVIGRAAGGADMRAVLHRWAAAGHTVGNHTFSHPDYHAPDVSAAAFEEDFLRADAVLRGLRGFQRFFRFPMLHGGDTAAKRDAMRRTLERHHYREAHVTIDTADWFIDRELRERFAAHPRLDARPYRDLYVRHMRAYAAYFREAAGAVFGRDIPHTILTHFNLVSALYLDDLLEALKSDGWSFVAATDAYADDVFRRAPRVLPGGDSLVIACAREIGRTLPKAPVENEQWLSREFERLRG